ncbi:helix-turn-helix domain-containing protein [Kitasatospora sp. HPMI-4]|uniref:helix-turn-helix domain-containing protein n=1 Tax=Kitasatospora sp. HPMI-4 TaxID=3448443 RepID=UPI003F1AD437
MPLDSFWPPLNPLQALLNSATVSLVTPNGYAIRAVREARGYSMRRVAGMAGTHRSTILRIEREQRGASPAVLQRIADALGVPIQAITRERQE